MNKIVSFELAKSLKEKGYDQKLTDNGYNINGHQSFDCTIDRINGIGIAAPTIAEVVMWLYDKHGIWIYTRPVLDNDGEWIFKGWVKLLNNFRAKEHQTKLLRKPNEAYESAILYCLKNLI